MKLRSPRGGNVFPTAGLQGFGFGPRWAKGLNPFMPALLPWDSMETAIWCSPRLLPGGYKELESRQGRISAAFGCTPSRGKERQRRSTSASPEGIPIKQHYYPR